MVHLDEDVPCDPATFGEALRKTREDAGLRIEDITAETKVSKGILNALENGDFRLLPERVFSRSFVAQYALTAGVDDGPLLRAFDEAWEGYCASSGTHPNLEVIAEDLGTSIRWRFWIPITTGVVILLIAAAVILRGSTAMDDVLAPDPRRSGVRLAAKSMETHRSVVPTPRTQPVEKAADPADGKLVDLTVTGILRFDEHGDPVDFDAFQTVDIYADGANIYEYADGNPRQYKVRVVANLSYEDLTKNEIVWEDEVEIGVDKGAMYNDPTPGQEFMYTIDVCNNRGAVAGEHDGPFDQPGRRRHRSDELIFAE